MFMKTENPVHKLTLPPMPFSKVTVKNSTSYPVAVRVVASSEKPDTVQVILEDGEECSRRQAPVTSIECGEEKQHLYALLVDALPKSTENDPKFWTNGDLILCKTADAADTIADLLETLGITDCATTGYFHPAEDKDAGIEDALTGYYYVDF